AGTAVNRDAYLRRLDGLVFGANPREGFFRGNEFLHPDLRFRVAFPEGWTTSNGRQAVVAVSPHKDAVVELSLAATPGADAALFAAATDNGEVRGTALFVDYRRATYRLLGYAAAAAWPAYQPAAEQALQSFAPLTERAALDVQPQRLAIVPVERRTTIAELARERPSPLAPAALALLNQVEHDTPLEPGRLIKWVVGERLR